MLDAEYFGHDSVEFIPARDNGNGFLQNYIRHPFMGEVALSPESYLANPELLPTAESCSAMQVLRLTADLLSKITVLRREDCFPVEQHDGVRMYEAEARFKDKRFGVRFREWEEHDKYGNELVVYDCGIVGSISIKEGAYFSFGAGPVNSNLRVEASLADNLPELTELFNTLIFGTQRPLYQHLTQQFIENYGDVGIVIKDSVVQKSNITG